MTYLDTLGDWTCQREDILGEDEERVIAPQLLESASSSFKEAKQPVVVSLFDFTLIDVDYDPCDASIAGR